jgi:hypothetical protein
VLTSAALSASAAAEVALHWPRGGQALLYLARTFYPTDHAQSFHTRHLAGPDALPAVTKAQVALFFLLMLILLLSCS